MQFAESIERQDQNPSDGETPFQFDEIFYSRTDPRGVILAGNDVFGRVAGREWGDLRGAPHRIIRHRDTPRAVFWVLWDRIRQGLPTGAYIKNHTEGGGFYWVYAVVTPVDGGYLSVRIKPSSSIFERCRTIYGQALAREASGLGPAASAAAMIADLHDSGFSTYDEFMGVALFSEVRARCKALDRTPPQCLTLIAEVHSLLRDAMRQKQALLSAFEDIRSIPINLHIVASRLEVYGGPVSTIAENYRLMSADVMRRLEALTGTGTGSARNDRIQTTVADGLFLTSATALFSETRDCCRIGKPGPGGDPATESGLLDGLDQDYRRRAVLRLGDVSRAAAHLAASCGELKRLMLGLDSIRVLCRVEAGRMTRGGEGLQAIIATLDRFHSEVAVKLNTILNLSRRIVSVTEAAARADANR